MAPMASAWRRSANTPSAPTLSSNGPKDQPVDPVKVRDALKSDPAITHVAVIHCETTSGILNPIVEVSKVVAEAGRKLLIDSMSAFGALPVDVQSVTFDAVAASSNKCIEGVPGLGFVLCRVSALEKTKGNAVSLTLDLFEQWQNLEKTSQYRFTRRSTASSLSTRR